MAKSARLPIARLNRRSTIRTNADFERFLDGERAMPRGFRVGHSGDLACPHRDVSCCDACARAHVEIVEVYGQHFWISDAAERDALSGAA